MPVVVRCGEEGLWCRRGMVLPGEPRGRKECQVLGPCWQGISGEGERGREREGGRERETVVVGRGEGEVAHLGCGALAPVRSLVSLVTTAGPFATHPACTLHSSPASAMVIARRLRVLCCSQL